jgi:arylsulfatase A-like enzyme
MKKLHFLLFLTPLSIIAFLSAFLVEKKEKTPNIVLIFMDDLGYGDLSSYGAMDYQTPNLDKMATEGIRFTSFLSAQAVCSASRSALMTGCYPNRIGFAGALFPNSKVGINADDMTLAELLKQKNYATAIFGKWHLGDAKQFLPLQHGFDEYFGIPYSNDMWPVWFDGKPASTAPEQANKNRFPPLPLIEGNEKIETLSTLEQQGLLTKRYTERAVSFIKKNKNKPFFLYVPHSMPHVPINASPAFKGKSRQGLYGDVMMEMDWSVGEILKSLKDNGLDKNTLVIFTSDNGPWLNFGNHAGSTGGLREGKGVSFEGGVRVPCLMRWKGTAPEGVVCNQLTSTIDILPTIAAICDVKLPKNRIDGVNILPILRGDMEQQPRKYFYYYYRKNDLQAVRRDNWKLVLAHQGRSYVGQLPKNDGFPGPAPENFQHVQALYDLRRDPAEAYDVQKMYPELVEELLKVAETAREDLGDDLTKREGKNRRQSGKIEN